MSWMMMTFALAALAIGVWIGLGAPGWPHKPKGGRSRLQKRPLNPITWKRQDSDRRSRRR